MGYVSIRDLILILDYPDGSESMTKTRIQIIIVYNYIEFKPIP